jgi:hypothetical protein
VHPLSTGVADIYFTEFDRIFRHFYSCDGADEVAQRGGPSKALFLDLIGAWSGEYFDSKEFNFIGGRFSSPYHIPAGQTRLRLMPVHLRTRRARSTKSRSEEFNEESKTEPKKTRKRKKTSHWKRTRTVVGHRNKMQ